ncbi:hypothetical protein ACFX1Q_023977 [Malus domestica]
MSERTVPVVKTSPISFYLRLPQQKHTLSAHPLNTSSSPKMHSQRILSSHSVFLIPWDTPANNPFKAKVFHIIKVESKRHGEIALEYSSSTADVLPKKLPHLPEEQIRQAKMIPTSCGDNVQKKQAEKNAACTIIPAEGV